jgi:TM2 domain-containing membrane protein YozV
MSDEKSLGDDLNDMLGDAKEGAKKAAQKAEEFGHEAKEKAKEFADDAKESAKEFSNSAKQAYDEATNGGDNKKLSTGILGILLGWIGIHKFILGYQKEGIILLVLGLLGFFTCGITSAISGIIGLIEGIIYLAKTDTEFHNTYQVEKKSWF